VVAPLWVAFESNLGTLLRTCDAVGACIAVPDTRHYWNCLARGDTLGHGRRPCIHLVKPDKDAWIAAQRADGWEIVAVELAEDALLTSTWRRLICASRSRWSGSARA
jgi:tRNA (guanosine-2'-O-)-methyltransferase